MRGTLLPTRATDGALGAAESTGLGREVQFGGMLPKLDRDVRREFVGQLAESGMSSRAIAPVVGVTHATVQQDVRDSGGRNLPPVKNLTPESGTERVPMGEFNGEDSLRRAAESIDADEVVDAEIVEDEPQPEPRVARRNYSTISRIPPAETA